MVIEVLRFRIPPQGCEAFIEQDAQIWDPVLRAHPGFVDKETWLDPRDPNVVILVIYWANREQWKVFPEELIQQLDQHMQPYVLHLESSQEYQLVRKTSV